MNILNYFNSLYAKDASKEQLRMATQAVRKSALTSDSGSGRDLIPEWLRREITNQVVTLVPELNLPTHIFDAGNRYQFTRIGKAPAPGSAMGEMSIAPITSSVYNRGYVDLKITKRKGGVSGFMKATSRKFIDSPTIEMENQLVAMGQDLRTYMLYGNAVGDAYTPWGVLPFIATNRDNLSGANQVLTNLQLLDDMIDSSTTYMGKQHKKCFLLSPNLLSALSRLITTVRDNRTMEEVKTVLINGGAVLESYRGVPFVETTALRPVYKTKSTRTDIMGTVTISAAGAGGAIPNNTYYFRVAPITWRGEQIASTSNNSITTSSNDSITLSFADVTDEQGHSAALYYNVYCSTTKDAEKLVRVVSAFTYDGVGTQGAKITSITFTSNPTVANTSVPTHMQNDIPLDRDGASYEPAEQLLLWDLDEVQGLGSMPYTNEDGSRLEGLVTLENLAKTEDFIQFMLKSYWAIADSFEKTSYLVRGIRTR